MGLESEVGKWMGQVGGMGEFLLLFTVRKGAPTAKRGVRGEENGLWGKWTSVEAVEEWASKRRGCGVGVGDFSVCTALSLRYMPGIPD